MNNIFSKNEIRLLELITGSFSDNKTEKKAAGYDIKEVFSIALHHGILPVIYKKIKEEDLSGEEREILEASVKTTASDFFNLSMTARRITSLFKKEGINAVILKGASIARFYPVPESRRSKDIDILLADPENVKKAESVLIEAGFKRTEKEYNANHHEVWGTPDNHVLELHTILVEPFDDKGFNDYINKRYILREEDILHEKVLGIELPMLFDDRLAFHLLLHMMMDFYRHGFGLKLLCDWVAFWNRDVKEDQIKNFLSDVEKCGQKGFLSVVTSTCIRYLGLKRENGCTLNIDNDKIIYAGGTFCALADEKICEDFLYDIIDTERNGKPDDERMVAMKNTGFMALVKEFHHQTKLYYPKASKAIITLPVLYVIVFVRFLINNKRVRGGAKLSSIVKEADRRSRLLRRINETEG
ncbi:MAG: nucleotidyltransferase family protein [Lachnospiraceae bacterium]|nr:nucleotidyltransferase family protein [Lachnospiraceae bacterium]